MDGILKTCIMYLCMNITYCLNETVWYQLQACYYLLRHKCGQMLSRLIVAIILQYLQVLNYYIIHLKQV